MSSKIAGTVQARIGSHRFPGKAMIPLGEKLLILHIFAHLGRVDALDEWVLATTISPDNDEMVEHAAR